MKLVKGEEKVIYLGGTSEDLCWGKVQFPKCYDMPYGKTGLFVHEDDDCAAALDKDPIGKWFVSFDDCKTWQEATEKDREEMGTILPNGDVLRPLAGAPIKIPNASKSPWYFGNARVPTDDEIMRPIPDEKNCLPNPITAITTVFGARYEIFWLDSIRDEMIDKRFCFRRKRKNKDVSEIQYVLPDWKYRLTYSFEPWYNGKSLNEIMLYYPGLYNCRKVKVAPDGSLYLAHYVPYGTGSNPFTGLYEKNSASYIFKSTDNGETWFVVGYIPYKYPNEEKDKFAYLKEGFVEPDIEFMPDGSILCILRTCEVFQGAPEWGPTYLSRSVDGGATWSIPEYFADRGALPKLLQLKNGVTLAVITRPGIYIYASDDCGKTWTNALEIMTDKDRSSLANVVPEKPNFHQWCGSCCNCDIKALEDNKAILFFSDFYIPDNNGVKRKGIKSIEILVDV